MVYLSVVGLPRLSCKKGHCVDHYRSDRVSWRPLVTVYVMLKLQLMASSGIVVWRCWPDGYADVTGLEMMNCRDIWVRCYFTR